MLLVVLLACAAPGPLSAAQTGDADGRPRIAAYLEVRRYTEAARSEVLDQFGYVVGEVDRFPGKPTPEQAKKSDLRKRLGELRLMMDFNAFAYSPSAIQRYRDLVDEAYETIGQYKDLHDVQQLDGRPIDPLERDRRWNAMINAVAPFRQADVREKLERAFGRSRSEPVLLEYDERPRLWQLAGLEPIDSLDSAGNAARLGHVVLVNLRTEGLLVEDIFDPEQEARFHDVRKALRSVLMLSDLFPALARGVAEVRKPLDDLVEDYGKANDQAIAYHSAERSGQNLAERADALRRAFEKAQREAKQFDERGHLDAFAWALLKVEDAHHR